jgi:5,10-methylenetetrahydromethanopterin reductase
MEFGFALPHELRADDLVSLAQEAERLGYAYAWLPDQTFYQDPFIALALIAKNTSRIHLGLGVTNPYARHPVQVARAIGTLAQLFPGRFSLGIGAGNRKELLTPLGLQQERPAQACREAVEIIRGLLAGNSVTHRGEFFEIQGVRLQFDVGQPPPLLIAGRGPATLQAAGEVADGVIVGALVSGAGWDFALDKVKSGMNRSSPGRPFPYTISWTTCRLTGDVRAAMDRARAGIAHVIGGAPPSVLAVLEIEPDRLRRLQQAYEEGGPSAAAPFVTDADMDKLSVIGDAEKVLAKLSDLQARGVAQFSMLLGPVTLGEAREMLEGFARQVLMVLQ